jgi:hypothetical protein
MRNMEMGKLEKFLLFVFETEYINLYKVGALLIAISLIGLSQTFPIIIDYDLKAKKSQFLIEELAGKEFDDIDCALLKEKKAECYYVKYLNNTNTSALIVSGKVISASLYLGIIILLITFCCHLPYKWYQYKNSHNPTVI